ncbi:MAG: 1-deoxy-D-xylulose-5-phosphate reductoisomerase [Deltaproteobacteria bacterium]|nr:1-deoxy-D-xylulose-5-phosphate reductoisomerase [Deltaproteobacteria bacterium]
MDTGQKALAVLGSTGSIGRNTLEVVRANPLKFTVASLAAGNNLELLKEQALEFKPSFVSVATPEAAQELRSSLPSAVTVGYGVDGAVEAATLEVVEMVLSAISGSSGLIPTMAAIKGGKDIALANKETLVMAGPLVMAEVKKRGVRLLPVDSEHSAVFQSLTGHRRCDIKRIILTASGGPFLKTPAEALATVTPAEALRHPKWKMGRKISVDSATLVNKGLEVIEASYLFELPPSKISVAIHPQSIVHSMVEYIDGSIVAQMSNPDMKGPIAYALSYPERIEAGTPPLNLSGLTLEFMEPDAERFPCLGLSYEALRMGGSATAVLNAADEVAVEMFLKGGLSFTEIYRVVSEVLGRHRASEINSIDDVLEADAWARDAARGLIKYLN